MKIWGLDGQVTHSSMSMRIYTVASINSPAPHKRGPAATQRGAGEFPERTETSAQTGSIRRVESVLRRGEPGIAHPGRPKSSFLFVRPTGMGKT
jgi:ATP-dependent Clp protease ATP-binding subunit ClpA